MTYLQKNNSKRGRHHKHFNLLVILVAIFLLGFIFDNFTSNLIHNNLRPIKNVTDFVFSPIYNLSAYFNSKVTLENRNTELEDENKMLRIEAMRTESLEEENNRLRNMLGLHDFDSEERLVAEVILTPPFSPYDNLVIYSEESLNAKQPVFVGSVLIGEIEEKKGDNNYVIRLYSSPNYTVPVRINEEILAEAFGQGNLTFKVEIPRDYEIEPGHLIYSATNPDLVIGEVRDIEFSETNPFQIVRFKYPFNFSNLRFVQVGKNSLLVE